MPLYSCIRCLRYQHFIIAPPYHLISRIKQTAGSPREYVCAYEIPSPQYYYIFLTLAVISFSHQRINACVLGALEMSVVIQIGPYSTSPAYEYIIIYSYNICMYEYNANGDRTTDVEKMYNRSVVFVCCRELLCKAA